MSDRDRNGGLLRGFAARGRTPATIAARLTYDNVVHRYGDVEAVRGVSLTIEPGEIVCLLGRSGCGKTTLLRLAAGVETPTSGRILVNDRPVAGEGGAFEPPEKRGIGLMFQEFALFPHLSNLANVMFGLRGLPKPDAEREARLALERVGLADYADAYPHMLSGGEQQRVALARAVVPRPGVLLMDEPFSGLDARLRDEVRDETLTVLRESRATCIIVTHDPEEAMRMADRIVLIRNGTLVQVDAPEAMYRKPADLYVARFFCDLNEVPGTVRDGAVDTPVGRFAAPGLADGTAAIVAIRPQGIGLAPAVHGAGMGADKAVAGTLLRRRFLGVVELVEIAVAGLEKPLKGRIRAGVNASPKSEVGVAIDPAEVLVFAASGA